MSKKQIKKPAKRAVAEKAKVAKVASPALDPSDPGPIPTSLRRPLPAKPAAKAEAKEKKAVAKIKAKNAKTVAKVKAEAKAAPPKAAAAAPQSAHAMLMAKLKGAVKGAPTATAAPAKGKAAKVVPMPKTVTVARNRTPAAPVSGMPLTAEQAKVGMKVRVFGLEIEDRVSSKAFTLQALDKGEKTPPGGPWFAINEHQVVHLDDLRVA